MKVREGRRLAKVKPDWIKIRTEYETTNISYRKLADKYNVSFKTLSPRAKREGWAKGKKETQDKIREKTGQKAIEKISDDNSKINALCNELTLLALQKAKIVLVDELTKITFFGVTSEAKAIQVDKLDKAMAVISKATKIDYDKRKLDIELKKLDIDREKLDIEKQKAGVGDDEDNETGVALIPAVDMEQYEKDKQAMIDKFVADKKAKEAANE
jgi:hypothetical protein